jgi:hypothetical protein
MLLKFLKKHFPHVKYPVKYIIRKRALGDVLWVEPLIGKLLIRCSRVVVVSDYTTLFENYPKQNVIFKQNLNFFEKLLYFFDKTFRINLVFINLNDAYEKFPKMHMLLAYFIVGKVNGKIEYPKLYLSKEELTAKKVSEKKYVVLHLEVYTNEFNYRNVYGINWEQVADHLHQKGYEVVQIGNKVNQVNGIRFIETTIREMVTLIHNACFFIGLDSGPSQIAASLGIPSIICFGSVNPLYRQRMDIFRGIILQQPCEYAHCYHERFNMVRRTCVLFGQEGIPKCSLHTSNIVNETIDNLISKYKL